MTRPLAILIAFVLTWPAFAQQAQDVRTELEQARAEAVRARGFIRATETQLSKTIAEIDAALAALDTPAPDPVDPAPLPEPPASDGFKPIARWATVPGQTVREAMIVEVAAFHIEGIDRIDFGAYGVATEPDPQTGLYTATVVGDSPVLRVPATVYPKSGPPRELETLTLYAEAPRTTIPIGPDTTIVEALIRAGDGGEVVLTAPGRYTFGPTTKNPLSNYTRPVLVRASVEGAVITQAGGMIRPHCVIHWRGVAFDYATISRYFYGSPWFDGCTFTGELEGETSPHLVTGPYYATNSTAADRVYGFTYATILRGSTVRNVWGDALQGARLILDCVVEDLDGSATGHHSDMFQIVGPGRAEDPDPENYIVYRLEGRRLNHVAAFFFKPTRWTSDDPEAFTKTLRNVALVDISLEWTPSPTSEVEAGANSQLQTRFEHVLFRRVNMPQQPILLRNDRPADSVQAWKARGVVFDDCNLHPATTTDADGVTFINTNTE